MEPLHLSRHQQLQHLVIRFTFSEIALTQGEHGTPHFPADRPALLAEGGAPFGKRVSLRLRRDRRSALEE
jgi:hypothetical protein